MQNWSINRAPIVYLVSVKLNRRGTLGVVGPGRFYFEVRQIESSGLARVGWALETASLDLGSDSLGYGHGADWDGFGINGKQGKKLHDNEIMNYGEHNRKG
ncbi:unnamed protein product [Protopolystoma xenopodis]|uniref:SPRY domain-containing protein n=1 Tax=Protopolystoma xenopodis TaxID=117903 RepID=A0A448XCR1_9PLAT|nr:unnamed protein product [Protopolystoma xenopodis]